MSQYRPPTEKSKYYLPKQTFLTVVHYCLQYPLWVDELRDLPAAGAIDYQKDRVITSPNPDQIERQAIRRAELDDKCGKVEKTAKEVAGPVLGPWLIKGVCYDRPYIYLQAKGIPCGKKMYYQIRRRFYYEMSKRI